jgi:hypothetical protein
MGRKHTVLVGETKNLYNTVVGKSEGGNHFDDLHVDANIILKWTLKQCSMRVLTVFIWLWRKINGRLL